MRRLHAAIAMTLALKLALTLTLTFTLTLCVAGTARADDFDGDNNDDAFRQCVTQSARSTSSTMAFKIMQNACLRLYRMSTMMNQAEKNYYACLLRSLQGVNNDIYAQIAAKACGDHH